MEGSDDYKNCHTLDSFFSTTTTLRSFAIRDNPLYARNSNNDLYHNLLHSLFSSLSRSSKCPIETLHIDNLSPSTGNYRNSTFCNALNEFISKTTTLRELSLLNFKSNNVYSTALLSNPSLTLLDIRTTEAFCWALGPRETELAHILRHSSTLQNVNFDGHSVSSNIFNGLLLAVSANTMIKTLSLKVLIGDAIFANDSKEILVVKVAI